MKNVVIIGSLRFQSFMEHLGELISGRGYHTIYPTKQNFASNEEMLRYNHNYLMHIENADVVILYDKYSYIGLHAYSQYSHALSFDIPVIKCSEHFDDDDTSIEEYMSDKEKQLSRFPDFDENFKILTVLENGTYNKDND